MTPEETSEALYLKYKEALNIQNDMRPGKNPFAKQCAIICVEQIIDGIHGVNEELELTSNVDISSHLTYYEEVLEQIKNS